MFPLIAPLLPYVTGKAKYVILGLVLVAAVGWHFLQVHSLQSDLATAKSSLVAMTVERDTYKGDYEKQKTFSASLKVYIADYQKGAAEAKIRSATLLTDCINQKPAVPVKHGKGKSTATEVYGVTYEDSEKAKSAISSCLSAGK